MTEKFLFIIKVLRFLEKPALAILSYEVPSNTLAVYYKQDLDQNNCSQ